MKQNEYKLISIMINLENTEYYIEKLEILQAQYFANLNPKYIIYIKSAFIIIYLLTTQ